MKPPTGHDPEPRPPTTDQLARQHKADMAQLMLSVAGLLVAAQAAAKRLPRQSSEELTTAMRNARAATQPFTSQRRPS